jgi:hypothetical protein
VSATILVNRAVEASLPVLDAGEPGWATDTRVLYIGDGATNPGLAVGSQSVIGGDVTGGTSGSILFVDASGDLAQANSDLYVDPSTFQVSINSGTSPGAQLHVTTSGAAVKALLVQGAGSQTANLLEIQDSSAAVLAAFDANGYLLSAKSGTPTVSVNSTIAGPYLKSV